MKNNLRTGLWFTAIFLIGLVSPPALLPAAGEDGRVDVLFLFRHLAGGSDQLGKAWQDILGKEGIKSRGKFWRDLEIEDLKKTKVLAMVDIVGTPDAGGGVSLLDRARLDNIQAWVKAGGGLIFCQQGGQILKPMHGTFAIGDRFDANVLFERTTDPGTAKVSGSRHLEYLKATVKGPAEVVGDARQVWCPPTSLAVDAGVLPVEFSKEWTVVLEGSPTSKSEPAWSGLDFIDRRKRKEGFQGRVPLAGVREYGQGRAVYCGLNINYLGFSYGELSGDQLTVLRDGIGEEKSDAQKLVVNLLKWAAGSAANGKGPVSYAELPVPDEKDFKIARRIYRGLIGPRSTYSSGQSTPEQYAAAARKAGLDYLIFLEEYARLKDGAFEKLAMDCERLTDENLALFPGLSFQDEYGDHIFVSGNGLELVAPMAFNEKKQLLIHPPVLKEVAGKILSIQTWFYTMSGFEVLAGFYNFSKNAVPYYDARDCTGMGVILSEGGRVVERNVEAYGEELGAGQMRHPLALTLMRDAREIEAGQCYTNATEAFGIRQLLKLTTFKAWCAITWAQPKDQWPEPGKTFLTNGPEVALDRTGSDVEGWTPVEGCRADGPANEAVGLYHPAFRRWAITLKARSPDRIREVRIYDGPRLLRRYQVNPPQEEYTATITIPQERQKYIWAHVFDGQGREAITRDVACKTHIMQEVQCGDRNNQLFYSSQKRPDGTNCLLSYGGPTAIPDKGPWTGRLSPAGYWVFDAKLGVEKYGVHDGSPEQHPQTRLVTALILKDMKYPVPNPGESWTHDLIKGIEGPAHVHPVRVIASGNVLVADRVMDGVMPVGTEVIHVWSTLFPVTPSKYLKTTARTTIYNILPDGVAPVLWDQSSEILQDIAINPSMPYYLHLGYLGGFSKNWAIKPKGGELASGAIAGVNVVHPFDQGSWCGNYGGKLGNVFCYSLSDGIKVRVADGGFLFGVSSPKENVAKGTRSQAKLLFVAMNRLTKDPLELAKTVGKEYGITEGPSYTVKLEQGQVLDRVYELKLTASQCAAVGVIDQTKGLPGNLGIQVQGCNSGWTAFLEDRSGGKLRVRPVPSAAGVVYAALSPSDQPYDLFLGNPARCSDQGILMDVAKNAENQWQIEAHNPTDQDKEVEITTHPAFRSFKFAGQVKIKAGESAMLPPR